MRIALDHLGWLGPDLQRLVAVFQGLGFRVLGPVPLQSGAARHPDAQWSAHVMFRDTYLELTALSADAVGHPLHRWRAEPPAVRLVLLRAYDAAAEHARLAATGWQLSEVQHAERRLAYGAQGVARFRWFGLREEPWPGTLLAWVEHLDRAALFDPDVTVQPNTVYAIEAVHLAGAAWPAALADEDAGNVELRHDRAAGRANAAVAGVDFLVGDLDACAQAMRRGGVSFTADRDCLEVPADAVGGARLRFRAPADAAR